MKILSDFKVKNKRVLLRCDFNLPLDERGSILDDFRLKKTIPTIEYLEREEAVVVLMSHLDEPQGKVVEKFRLNAVQERLMEYLDVSISKASDCIGKEIEKWTLEMQPGEIVLLENLRFHRGEEANDPEFAKSLSKLGDIYINDAFGVCHRNHASVVGLAKLLPSGAGFLLDKEINILSGLLKNPKKPMVAVIGGKKAETKAPLIDNISEIADYVLVGGLMEKEIKEKNIVLKNPSKIIFPTDTIVAKEEKFDIGPETIKIFKDKLSLAKTIFWSGPLGMIEKEEFQNGSREIAMAITESKVFSVAGGGETVQFLNEIGLVEKFNHISSGGGAMLTFLSGNKLPGIEVLKNEG